DGLVRKGKARRRTPPRAPPTRPITSMNDYESRLDKELLSILQTQRVAALGTLQANGTPYVSMTPYAIDTRTGRVVLQVSSLAPHAQHMRDDPRVSLLVIDTQVTDLPSSALPRVTLEGRAEF